MSVSIAKANYPEFAGASGISGKRLVMFVNYGSGATPANPVWNLVGGLTNNNLNLSAETNSAQTKDHGFWPITTITSKSYEVNAEVIMLRDNVAQEAIEAFMVDDEITAEKKLLNIAIVDLDTKDYYNLTVAPTGWEITAESEDMITKSFTATGSGAPVKASGFVVPGETNALPPVTFSKAAAADVVLTVPSGTITGLKKGDATVSTDYYSVALGGQSIVILGSYLDDLDNGTSTFTVVLSDATTIVTCDITITA